MSELRLTATDALARALRQQHALDQRRAGRAVWEAPRIVSLEQWVADTWAETWPQEQLLSGSQGLALWLAAIERDNPGLLSTLACARAALAAERLLLRYRLDAARLPAYSAEERAWLDWHAQVRRRMDQQGWLLAEELPWRLARIIDAGDIALPQQVVLHGFDGPLDPAAAALLQALARRCRCRRAEPPAIAPVRLGLRPSVRVAQYRYVAATIAERLRRTETPPRIVVVLPDAAQRLALEAALLDHVAPWRLRIGNPHGAPWRWSQGLPLAAQPLIDSAQALLALQPGLNDFDTLSRLLLSPVLWPGPASEAAAELETGLRRRGWPRLRLSMLIRVAPAAVAEALSRLAAVLATEPRRALPSRWAQAFEQRLQALGWPGPGQLPSAAFQRVRELRRRLARLGAFDRLLGEIDASRARFWFDELLHAGFEPRADHEQPLLIADPAQAVALPCDLLLVCDASVDAFPGRAAPTPFLAIEAQRAAGVPEASAETHRAAALAQAAALCAQAGEIQVLVPAVDERGAELLPSALFDVDWQPDAPQPRASLS
ncbi:MAG: hypothetical protein KGJ55_12455, partial [Gammaproteobacteria bacterium]|nr:hypothetical protein [Gammaproteobacteria bacterium]